MKKTLENSTGERTSNQLTLSLGDFPASHSAMPGNERERKTTDISGRKCLKQLKNLNHTGLLVKTLLGSKQWKIAPHLSNGFYLEWKVKILSEESIQDISIVKGRLLYLFKSLKVLKKSVIKSKFTIFQLQQRGRGTKGKGYGSLPTIQTQGMKVCENGKTRPLKAEEIQMLATPNTMDHLPPKTEDQTKNHRSCPGRSRSGNLREQIAYNQVPMLPTPRTVDVEGGTVRDVKQMGTGYSRINKKGERFGAKLRDVIESGAMVPTPSAGDDGHPRTLKYVEDGYQIHLSTWANFSSEDMLPTVRSSEYKDSGPVGSKSHTHMDDRDYLCAKVKDPDQPSSVLNPDWVEWLMGYPVGWTDLERDEVDKNIPEDHWDHEVDQPRVVPSFPGRADRIKAMGNAIVPKVALQFFDAICKSQTH